MTLAFIILFLIFIIAGPLYWWARNLNRHILRKENNSFNKSIKWVWLITSLIGIAFGFMAILLK